MHTMHTTQCIDGVMQQSYNTCILETTQCRDGVMQQSHNTCILVRQALPRWQGNFCDSYRLRVIVHKQCITIVVKVYTSLGKHFVHKQMCVCARVYVFVIVASIILCSTCIIVYKDTRGSLQSKPNRI